MVSPENSEAQTLPRHVSHCITWKHFFNPRRPVVAKYAIA